ncbi:MAG: type III-A CRISPR-associated protein Csm2 [Candidatus Kryptonium sp.]
MSDRIISFWKDRNQRLINPDLFSEVAESLARKIREEGRRDKDKNKITQVRKFYDEILQWYELVRHSRKEYDKYLPYIKILRAKVYYAKGRKLVTETFVKLIEQCLDEIHTFEDFEVFKSFFEAFMGFYRYYDEVKTT